MKVLLERRAGGYRASAPPLGESVEAETRDEALNALRDRIVARLVGESEWVELEIPLPESELVRGLADDPTFDDWQAIIAQNRRKENEALGIYPEHNPMPQLKK
ncbi:hypothetical protein [Armatimonas sp.]|uniref:hypothetical protein n=1 Tax=Armatimonas sp. TaxID=1872638 RepID=UPI0037536654